MDRVQTKPQHKRRRAEHRETAYYVFLGSAPVMMRHSSSVRAGKQARLYQTWSIAGFLTAKLMLKNPNAASWLTCDEDETYAIFREANPQKRKFKASPKIFVV